MTDAKKNLTRADVEIRPATEADREAMLRIADQTWDGHDYLPRVLDSWLADEEGVFNVMTLQGQIIAFGKLTKLDDKEWWLEGLRVDPDYRGRGVARILHHYSVAQSRQIADGVLRFSTGASNEAVAKLAMESGFQVAARFITYSAPANPDVPTTWWSLDESDFSEVRIWLDQSEYFQASAQSFEHRWVFRIVTDKLLRALLKAGQIYAWHPDGKTASWQGLLIANPPHYTKSQDDPIISFAYADVQPELMNPILGLVGQLGGKIAQIKVVDSPQYADVLTGWQVGEAKPVLYSRPIVLTAESQVRFEELPTLKENNS